MNNIPEWLQPGTLVEFAFSVGEILDVAVSPERIMVLVKSPKGIWRNHPAEWLEYKPGAIQPTTPERAAQEIELYRSYILKMLHDLDATSDAWANEGAYQKATLASMPT